MALRRLLPSRIAAQLAMVVVASVIVIHLVITASFHFLSSQGYERDGFVHVGVLVRLIDASPSGAGRVTLITDIDRAFPALHVKLVDQRPGLFELDPEPGPLQWLFGALPPRMHVGVVTNSGGRGPIDVRSAGARPLAFGLADGQWLIMEVPSPPLPPLVGPITVSLIFAGMCTSLLGLWAMHALVRPLRRLAAAARDFDIEGETPPLLESGPEEVRIASRAFDAMRDRIRVLVEDRTRMLAAMGHDLRTPITRLRLRSEYLPDEGLREDFLRDLRLMNEMIEGALTYLREGRHEETPNLVDLSAMLQTLCDPWSDAGRSVEYSGPNHLTRRVRGQAITRAMANLIDNAVKYGTHVVVRLENTTGGGCRVEVEDDGPGIPEADREMMLRPFVRGDSARNLDDARGFGLGLAIARAVVEGHGGSLALLSAEPTGLLVRVDLPSS